MTDDQCRALTSIALLAAFADGSQSDAERAQVKDMLESMGNPATAQALRRVVLKETTLPQEAAALDTPELRQIAWETGLGVCEADGATSAAERAFLDALAEALDRPLDIAHRDVAEADAMQRAVAAPSALEATALRTVPPSAMPPGVDPRGAEVDATIIRFATLTAAVELLPQSLATMAIIPLQTKMVHGIGQRYGHALSAASFKEFAATIGIGMTGQVVEQYARKFLRLIGGAALGGMGRLATNWGTGPALTFATTYGIGMVAKQYYAGGRTLSAVDLRSIYGREVERAKTLYQQYEPEVRRTASATTPAQVLQTLRA